MDIRILVVMISALLSPLAAIGVWWLKREMEDRRDQRQREEARQKMVRAIYAEIDFNTFDMSRFLDQSMTTEALRKVLGERPELVPHITDARHTEIYRNRVADIDAFNGETLHMIVIFYGLLEKIRAQIEGINFPSYRTLSLEGRLNAVEVIRRTAKEAEKTGLSLLIAMETESPDLRLARAQRGDGVTALTAKELSLRLIHFDERIKAARRSRSDS